MKYYVELGCELTRPSNRGMIRPFVLYPVDATGKFVSDGRIVLDTHIWEDLTGYVVWDL